MKFKNVYGCDSGKVFIGVYMAILTFWIIKIVGKHYWKKLVISAWFFNPEESNTISWNVST